MEEPIMGPQPGSQEIAMQSEADVIIFGGAAGSGKSHLIMMHPLQHIHDPKFAGIFFRRVTKQLEGLGGLWQESQKMYAPWNPHVRNKGLTQTFPSGAQLQFCHMEHERDKTSHQGLQYSMVAFDELTHFSETQFTYLLSRLRSDADVKSYCLASCNPDADSWVLKWIEWWLTDEGVPDDDKKGVIRYYLCSQDGTPVFGATAQEIKDNHPEKCRVWNQKKKEWIKVEPKTLTFIGGTIFDNEILMEKNPGYIAELNALPTVERARLLDGNWYARAEGSGYFKREWLHKVDTIPLEGLMARGWDKASQEPSTEEPNPDFTASVKMIKDQNGHYTIVGGYHPDNRDEKEGINGIFRKRMGARDKLISKQGHYDGRECRIVLPEDPGAAGKVEYQMSAAALMEEGLLPVKDPSITNNSKLTKFTPFAVACENGLVSIHEGSFGDLATLNYFYSILEGFTGERSGRKVTKKDDIPDSCATTFNYLCQSRVMKFPPRNQVTSQTQASKLLQSSEAPKLTNEGLPQLSDLSL